VVAAEEVAVEEMDGMMMRMTTLAEVDEVAAMEVGRVEVAETAVADEGVPPPLLPRPEEEEEVSMTSRRRTVAAAGARMSSVS
jgi:hypothetical protein